MRLLQYQEKEKAKQALTDHAIRFGGILQVDHKKFISLTVTSMVRNSLNFSLRIIDFDILFEKNIISYFTTKH